MSNPSSTSKSLYEGYLHKRSKHLKKWKIRYFILHPTGLSYAKQAKKKIRYSFRLDRFAVLDEACEVDHEGNFVFGLKFGSQVIYLSTPSIEGRREWVQAIRQAQTNAEEPPTTPSATTPIHPPRPKLTVHVSSTHDAKARRIEKKNRHKNRWKSTKTSPSLEYVWLQEILPNWKTIPKENVEELCWIGIPKHLRGRVWLTLLGNNLQINEELFEVCKTKAQGVILESNVRKAIKERERQKHLHEITEEKLAVDEIIGEVTSNSTSDNTDHASDSDSSTSSALADANPFQFTDHLITSGERNIRLLRVDIPRTFGHHPFYEEGSEGHRRLQIVLEAYTCYRPDLGYVQGMSYLAATLCFHMDEFSSFKALAALLSTRIMFDMYRLEPHRTLYYIDTHDRLIELDIPELGAHFQEIGMESKMFMVDWALTLFTRVMPLEVAYRLWDSYVLLGSEFFFQASLGILRLYKVDLLQMDLGEAMKFLHLLPESITIEEVLEHIDEVQFSRKEIMLMLDERTHQCWSPVEANKMPVEFPENYDA